jgi:hypothetical protein
MRKALLTVLSLGCALAIVSCAAEEREWDPAVEQSTFTEIEQSLPAAREAAMALDELINRRMSSRYRDDATEELRQLQDFMDAIQFYYMPILNARAHIARAYREIDHGMYTEASEDIRKAADNLTKASLKSTEATKAGFEEVKRGLMEVQQVSDDTAETSMVKLSNAAKKLNLLIERIKPTVVKTEEGESLIDGQL